MINLPLDYKDRMRGILGAEYSLYEKSLENPPVKAFRVNTDKISLEDFDKLNCFGKEKIPYVKNGFYLEYEKIGNHPYHHAGMIYVQEPAAMAPAECIDIDPKWWILDMCAAPGGKSSQLKTSLGEKGLLVSNEIIPSRCKILTGNIERLGLRNTVTTCMDSDRLAKIFPKTFDLIMVDAPCSGEGMFRKEEAAVTEWSLENVLKCAKRQEEILENAVKCLKNGGYIVYSTCTFSLEENEMTVDSFLQRHPEFELCQVRDEVLENSCDGISFVGAISKNLNLSRRFYPHKTRGEGQFVAVLHNAEASNTYAKTLEKYDKIPAVVTDFLNDTLTDYNPESIKMHNGNPVFFDHNLNITSATVFSYGSKIGEIKKNYILPHHQFFMAFGDKFKRKIELTADSEQIRKYLHGEEIETDCQNGWAVVLVDGCAVGGAKVVSGIAKNHYPKGLRIL